MIIIKYSLLILIKFKKRRNDNRSTKRDLLNNTQLPPVTLRQKFPNAHPLHDIKDQENLKNPVQKIFIHRRSTTSYPIK